MPRVKGWIPVWSAAAAMRAVRATVVVAGLFAFTDKVIGNLQMATFAAFGGFATLVLASFAGTRRDKLLAHLSLALAGSVLLTIGTAVHSPAALAAIATVPVAFTVFFAGILGPNAASGATAALLAYVLPVASPGTISTVPDRLAGWWLASVAGTAAVLALSPRGGDDQLRAAASTLATSLADELDAALDGGVTDEQQAAMLRRQAPADHAIQRRAVSADGAGGLRSGVRPFGRAARVVRVTGCGHGQRATRPESTQRRKTALCFGDAAAVLRSVAASFSGRRARPDLTGSQQARERTASRGCEGWSRRWAAFARRPRSRFMPTRSPSP